MKMQVYSILDNVSGNYGNPQLGTNDATAIRATKDLINRDENIRNHASDYALYRIGEFDDQTARIEPLEKPELLLKLGTIQQV